MNNEFQETCSTVSDSMLLAAIELAGRGWPVFPCQEAGREHPKAPHVRGGFKSATTDLGMIRRWWKEYPNALIGLALPKTLLVLDVDPRNGGSLEALQEKIGRLPETLRVESGRGDGGTHYYFRHPGIPLYGRNLPEGVDLKEGGKGYVIAPPSLHPETGMPYKWIPGALSSLTVGNVKRLAAKPAPSVASRPTRFIGYKNTDKWRGVLRVVETAAEGQRNRTLFWAACRMAENNADQNAWEALNLAGCRCGLDPLEVARTIHSAQQMRQESQPPTRRNVVLQM
ncbi:bifunctional DNA primase/polymerase [Mobiluncus mulieris]|uniref:DNA primase n=1 Tax=Mobiluncus mulieris TaxID=2052 RepID=A0A7Y0YIV8_9ACTO|nr:bifunctional DNA primase/polymerase [Mobiluncus mulieris]NMX04438.1 DNA primase [Mobiluncus mulieris]NMX12267.1 DNA primase [Mobiluncus mulieris]